MIRLNRVGFIFCACMIIIGSGVAVRRAEAATAYAHVLGNGTLDTAHSKNVVAIDGGNGLFCFKLKFVPKNAQATIADDPTAPNQGLSFIEVALPPTPLFTCANIPTPDAVVMTADETMIGGGTSAGGHAFYVLWSKQPGSPACTTGLPGTSSKIICTAMVADKVMTPPNSMTMLPMLLKLKQKGNRPRLCTLVKSSQCGTWWSVTFVLIDL